MTMWFNRRTLAATLLIVGAAMLQGCVYDPYTGAYVPCCAYPAYGYYPAGGGYAYPAYGGYGGAVVVGGGGYYRGGYGGGGYRGGYGWYR